MGVLRSPGPCGSKTGEDDALPQEYLEFIRHFNDGHHWRAQEVLAELWRVTTEPERRSFYQGLIQLAAALIHAERNNPAGAERLLAKARENLASVRSPYMRMDVSGILRAIEYSCCEGSAASGDRGALIIRFVLQAVQPGRQRDDRTSRAAQA